MSLLNGRVGFSFSCLQLRSVVWTLSPDGDVDATRGVRNAVSIFTTGGPIGSITWSKKNWGARILQLERNSETIALEKVSGDTVSYNLLYGDGCEQRLVGKITGATAGFIRPQRRITFLPPDGTELSLTNSTDPLYLQDSTLERFRVRNDGFGELEFALASDTVLAVGIAMFARIHFRSED